MKENIKRLRDDDFRKPSSTALFATLTIVLSIALSVTSLRCVYLSDTLKVSMDLHTLHGKHVVAFKEVIQEKEAEIVDHLTNRYNLEALIITEQKICIGALKEQKQIYETIVDKRSQAYESIIKVYKTKLKQYEGEG